MDVDGALSKAMAFPSLTGEAEVGDIVLLNTTAEELGLGTGGYHFVICNHSRQYSHASAGRDDGHIMKLRYTPLQHAVLSVEEEASPYSDIFEQAQRIDGVPVICCALHSQIEPAVAMLHLHADEAEVPRPAVVYVMTDGGSLPLGFSNSVASLKQTGLIAGTVTMGNSFGGDLEAVSLHNALVAAVHVLCADVVIVAMGPGITGTATPYGFSGFEQGVVSDAVTALGGQSIFVSRVSFADDRPRHHGLSHHMKTVLELSTHRACRIPVPRTDVERERILSEQSAGIRLPNGAAFKSIDASRTGEALERLGIRAHSMGRGYDDDPCFFQAAGAAGSLAWELMQPAEEAREHADPASPQVLTSESIYSGDYLSLRKDIVHFPGGHVGTREVITHPGAVGVVVVTEDGLVPLVSQYRHATCGPVLELPAGLLDPGETPAECALREVREEVGGTGGVLTELGWFYTTPGNSDEKLHLFLLEGAHLGQDDPDEGEDLELRLVTPAAGLEMIASGEIVDSKTIVGFLRAFGSPGAAGRHVTGG